MQVPGNKEQQVEGEPRQAEGKAQKTVGNVKEGVKDAFKKP